MKNSDKSLWIPDKPYDDLPLLPPRQDVETRAVLKRAIGARAALAGLKQACGLIPNPAILINVIPLLEARASSEIENIVTTNDALFRYAANENQAPDSATKEALRYRSALREGFDSLKHRPINTTTAEKICSRIKNVEMQVRRVPGTALKNVATDAVIYTPPLGEALIRQKLANWERFMHPTENENLDPLVRMAVAHYQFEAIHPFTDGNGRTGRILNLLFLVEQELLNEPVLYLSKFIIDRRTDYYRLLHGVTSNEEWEPWVLYMLEAVEQTAKWTTQKIHAIRHLIELTKEHFREAALNIYSRELLDIIFEQPYSRIQNIVETGLAQRQAASTHLKTLVEIQVLKEIKVGREKIFLHPKLLTLLTSDSNKVVPYPKPKP